MLNRVSVKPGLLHSPPEEGWMERSDGRDGCVRFFNCELL